MKILAKSCFLRSILLIVCLVFSIHSFGYMPVDRNESPKYRNDAIKNRPASGSGKTTNVKRDTIPEAIRKINKRPVAIAAPVINVKAGEEFLIDGSRSYDPEGQPLIYRWNAGEGWLWGNVSQSAILKIKAPAKPGTVEYKFWVIDGIRCSEPARIKVNITN